MSTSLVAPDQFDLSAPAGGEILAVANALSARAAHHSGQGEIVIVARAGNREMRSVGSSIGPVRAAVSVAVDGGHDRLWAETQGTDTVEMPIHALPEVIRTAASPIGYTHAHVGCVRDDGLAAVAVWFSAGDAGPDATQRKEAMQLLAAAAERQREYLAMRDQEARERAAFEAALEDAEETGGPRTFDPDDPNFDPVTGLASRDRFEETLEEYESDEATLVVVDVDEFDAIVSEHGDDVANTVLRELADRLLDACRRDDVIARLGASSFAVLLHEASRAVGLQVAKRLLETMAQPLPFTNGPDAVTATVAMAHQFGLVDTDELIESADLAVASGRRAGSNRLVIAS
ncbi:MAG: GGDEF domain-containing protein [Ilumatobacter sp.]|nr:GGDEF domain-containing protein [Ilumatobacter sp.]